MGGGENERLAGMKEGQIDRQTDVQMDGKTDRRKEGRLVGR